jgi:hypothetical protein
MEVLADESDDLDHDDTFYPYGSDQNKDQEVLVMGGKPEYLKLKEPSDVLAYVQRLVNRLRRQDLETDPVYIGKIIYMLNTWIQAYKVQMESIELKQLREEIEGIKARLEVTDDIIRPKNR